MAKRLDKPAMPELFGEPLTLPDGTKIDFLLDGDESCDCDDSTDCKCHDKTHDH